VDAPHTGITRIIIILTHGMKIAECVISYKLRNRIRQMTVTYLNNDDTPLDATGKVLMAHRNTGTEIFRDADDELFKPLRAYDYPPGTVFKSKDSGDDLELQCWISYDCPQSLNGVQFEVFHPIGAFKGSFRLSGAWWIPWAFRPGPGKVSNTEWPHP